jgi:nitrate/TMAO reductase-like tetraheme cytochrome c subunit
MKQMIKYRSSLLTILIILLCGYCFSTCINDDKNKSVITKNNDYSAFAGSASCSSCHKNIYDAHINTAHFSTSAIASDKNIKGSFDAGKNTFVYNNGGMVAMEKRATGFYQVAYIDNIEKKSQRFDMVIGSGTKGQSFACWANDKLFQLPITYFTSAGQWSNSPGYPNKIAFNRPISSRCLECHSTYAEIKSEPNIEPESFNRSKMILGVDCERCHGPARKHVEYQTRNPADTMARFIINPAQFSRRQSLDLCALCHGGRMQKSTPSFSFTAGNNLADYFITDTIAGETDNIDVHGNQYGLLKASKCFRRTKTLTCITCHNTHVNEKGNTAVFSQRCISCHNNTQPDAVLCRKASTMGAAINKDCITCHMPQQPSMAIAVMLQGSAIPAPALMHTHLIKIYKEQVKAVTEMIKSDKQ